MQKRLEQYGLSRTVGSNDREVIATLHVEAQVVKDTMAAERDGQPPYLEHGIHGHSHACCYS